MKFTLAWLKDHLETDATLDEIAETLTMIGLEVEAIDDPAKKFAPFIVAGVTSAEKHPDADRLKVCMVDTGSETVQVVCGAPNAKAGMKGVFAPAGAVIPATGLELTKSRIRGVESNGMLCSERELGLSDEHTGIIALDTDAPAGTPFAQVMGLDDPVIEIAVTPNRPDCLGVHGIARDLAAAGIGTLKDSGIAPVKGEGDCPVSVTLDFPDGDSLCPAFGLRLVRGVKNGDSPAWLQQRLRAIGLRPINALVDITNYITFDRGRPLHVFDAARVNGNLTVRRAKQGETLLALDERTYTLDPSICVIADETGVESLSGIMGGEATGCTEDTTDILIESALWVPANIAQSGRKLSILSDARFRFERGVDPAFMLPGLDLATKMVLDMCGGAATGVTLAGEVPEAERVIAFDTAIVKRLAGLAVPDTEIGVILKRLGFWMAGGKAPCKVAVPSWRPDVHGPADLVEEIVRIVGLDKVTPAAMPRLGAVAKPVLTLAQNRRRNARRALAARGLMEAVTWSFVSAGEAAAFGGGAGELKLANPISADLSDMRPSILPGLISAAQRNADRGSGDVALFEVGPVYHGEKPDEQAQVAAGVRRGASHMVGSGRHWAERAAPADAYDAKADALAALAAAGAPADSLQTGDRAPDWYHPGRSGTLGLGPTVLAAFGELHPLALEALGADGPLVGFEVFLDAIPAPRAKATKSRPALNVSDLQPVRRDFAFVVDETVKADDLVRAAKGADKQLIVDVGVFDVFAGKALGEGKKSIAIEVTLQPHEKTLTDEEIDAVAAKIVAAVEKATGGALRG